MHPEQILIAIEELWNLTQNPNKPASEIINEYTRSRRYIGSKDRKQIVNAVWDRWRQKDYPTWLKDKIKNFTQEWDAMNLNQAPTVLRVNGDRIKIKKELEKEEIQTTFTEKSPLGLVLEKRINLNALKAFKDGLIEVQDEGSQLIGLAVQAQPNERILELCAGAGGKSLLFAQVMQNKGLIIASDISERSLNELKKRAQRAKASIIQTKINIPNEKFDAVVIDAPCSGTGTYRRAPDNVHKLTIDQFNKILQTQKELLEKALSYVHENSRICYMTCSLTEDENVNQITDFLNRHADWVLVDEQHFTPATTNTDGFYIATLKKNKIHSD